jgi:hypothetical protein
MPNNAAGSGGSNLGPSNPALLDAVKGRIAALRAADPANTAAIPVDLVTASASGLDPEISVAAARYQAGRIASARHISREQVLALIERETAAVAGLLRRGARQRAGAESGAGARAGARLRVKPRMAFPLRSATTRSRCAAGAGAGAGAARARGKLRIYFGASAGVGKTYAMLAAARKLQAEGSRCWSAWSKPTAAPRPPPCWPACRSWRRAAWPTAASSWPSSTWTPRWRCSRP